jgi:hypothetical protein
MRIGMEVRELRSVKSEKFSDELGESPWTSAPFHHQLPPRPDRRSATRQNR